jgi:hypothetical protein
VEEPFDLRCMEIDRDDMVDADSLKQVGNHAGGNRFAPAVTLVCACVAEIRDHDADVRGRSTAARVGERKKLDQVVVYGRGSGARIQGLGSPRKAHFAK